MKTRRRQFDRSRSLLCLALLVGQFMAVFGFPVLVTAANTQRSCAGAACGCSEELRSSRVCCCYPAQASCCGKPAGKSCCEDKEPATTDEPAVRWVSGFSMRKCQGENALGVPNAEPSLSLFETAPTLSRFETGRIALVSYRSCPLTLDPPVPPPRLV